MKWLSWRTVIVAVIMALLIVLCLSILVLALHAERPIPETFAKSAFEFSCYALVTIVLAVAGKGGVEKLAGGGGIKGAFAALFTSAKPEPPQGPSSDQPKS